MKRSRTADNRGLYRIIDANYNRAMEGLRVCEDIARFILQDKSLTGAFKRLRHRVRERGESAAALSLRVACRESGRDPGRRIFSRTEFTRATAGDILLANMQRVKESVRVLEEFSKLIDTAGAAGFKELRYRMYELEKEACAGMQALRHRRHPTGRASS